jgi:hypothetical protein
MVLVCTFHFFKLAKICKSSGVTSYPGLSLSTFRRNGFILPSTQYWLSHLQSSLNNLIFTFFSIKMKDTEKKHFIITYLILNKMDPFGSNLKRIGKALKTDDKNI